MITGPMYQNPLAGGSLFRPQENQLQGDALVEQMQMRMNQRDQKTPAFLAYFKDVMDTKGYPTKTMEEYGRQFPNPLTERIVTQEDGMNLSGSNVPLSMLNATPPSVPVSEQTPMSGLSQVFSPEELVKTGQFLPDLLRNPVRPKSDDPIRQGFFDSEFYKPNAPSTADVVNYTYQGKPMTGSGSNISQFQQYLDSIGKGNLIQRNDQIFSQETGPLATVSGPNDNLNPFQEQFTGFQNQLTGFGDQFTSLNDRLTKIEEGISSLLGNKGQGLNLGYNPMMNFGMGIGSLFQPLRGFYGQRF